MHESCMSTGRDCKTSGLCKRWYFVALISESAQACGRAYVTIQVRFMCFAPNRFQRYGKPEMVRRQAIRHACRQLRVVSLSFRSTITCS